MYHWYSFLSGLIALSVIYDSRSFSLSQLLSFLSLAAVLFVFSYQLFGGRD